MGYQDSFYLCSSHGVAMFLMARGHIPFGVVRQDGLLQFRFPAKARAELEDARAARGILNGMAQMVGTDKQWVATWLRSFLADGPRTTAEVREAAIEARIRWRVLSDPETTDLAGVDRYHPTPDSPWLWRLKTGGAK